MPNVANDAPGRSNVEQADFVFVIRQQLDHVRGQRFTGVY